MANRSRYRAHKITQRKEAFKYQRDWLKVKEQWLEALVSFVAPSPPVNEFIFADAGEPTITYTPSDAEATMAVHTALEETYKSFPWWRRLWDRITSKRYYKV